VSPDLAAGDTLPRTILPDLCESARAESLPLMISHARALGPHAVVRVWYDAGPMVGAAEVLSYGTAGVVEAGGDRR